jgi:hypothetical protein
MPRDLIAHLILSLVHRSQPVPIHAFHLPSSESNP